MCQILGRPVSKGEEDSEGGNLADMGRSNAAPLHGREPGTIHVRQNGLYVSCGGATEMRVLSVKMEGGRAMDAVEYARVARLTEGERFGNA